MLRRPIPNKKSFYNCALGTSHRPVHQKFHQGTTAILASKMGLQAWEVVVVQTSEKQSLCIVRLRGVCLSLSLSRCITHRLVTFPNDETKTKLFYRYFFANTQYDLCKPFSTLIDLNSHGICKWNRQALICSKHFEDHGCYHELCRLLGKINVHRQNLFLLGQEKKELGHHANHKHPFLTIGCAWKA